MILAIEGIDACGKETQISMLKERFPKAHTITYPDYSSVTGQVIQKMLNEENPDPVKLQALMTVNRLESQPEFLGKEHVFLDRYWLSGYVYGTVDGLSQEWLMQIHRALIQPDVWVVLDISAEESIRRRKHRQDLYESNFDRLCDASILYKNPPIPCAIIDGERDPEVIHAEILRKCFL